MNTLNKYANLYDIDGNLISEAPLKNKSIDEVEKIVEHLSAKVKDEPENEIYKVYLENAQKHLMHMYNTMSQQDLINRFITKTKQDAENSADIASDKIADNGSNSEDNKDTEDGVDGNTNIVERDGDNVPEVGSSIQSDLLGEHQRPETVMEEYVDFEEVK